MHLPDLRVSCTCVRVPVVRSHSVSLVVRTREKISVRRAKELIAAAPGCRLGDDLSSRRYPMPLDTSDQDTVRSFLPDQFINLCQDPLLIFQQRISI